MTSNAAMLVLRIAVGSNNRHGGRLLHEAIVESVRDFGMAGATVIRGMLGYGKSSVIHRTSLRARLKEFPLVVRIVDHPKRIAAFLPRLKPMIQDGFVTVQALSN